MKPAFRPCSPHHQAGATLIIALIFLVVLTMLGIGIFYSTTSEEKMARNLRDQEIALHAAEAAYNEAVMLIKGQYDTSNAPNPIPLALNYARCYNNKPSGFICRDHITAVSPSTTDLFASTDAAALGTYQGTGGTPLSATIKGISPANQARYLIVLGDSEDCGASNTGDCYMILAQARGRLGTTRVNLVELFIN